MPDMSCTPTIAVAIGRQTRLYHAFVTTAPADLDAPLTITLYAGPLSDVAGLAVDSVALDATKAGTPSRLVLIDTTELGWQRARCRSRAHRLIPADPVLVGLDTVQRWLWQRLQIPMAASHERMPTHSARRLRRRPNHDDQHIPEAGPKPHDRTHDPLSDPSARGPLG